MSRGFCWLVVASPLHSKPYLEGLKGVFSGLLGEGGFKGVFTSGVFEGVLEDCGSVLAVVATGGTESLVLGLAERAEVLGVPVVFLGLPRANSLPALLEAAPLLRGLRGVGVAYLPCVECGEASRLLGLVSSVLRGVARFRGSRLGLVGGASPWLVYSVVGPEAVREKMGVEVVEVGLEEVYEEYWRAGRADAVRVAERVAEKASRVEVGFESLVDASRLYLALKKIVERYGLSGVTVKCFDVIRDLKTTACLALSLLNSEGLVAGCEGDVPSALAMMVARMVLGSASFMANPAAFRGRDVLLAHCTIPLVLSKAFALKTHFESGLGVGVAGFVEAGGLATLLRLSPSLDRARIVLGRVVEGEPRSLEHCRTQVWVRIGVDPVELFLERSFGNHYVLIPGNHVDSLNMALGLLGVEVEEYTYRG